MSVFQKIKAILLGLVYGIHLFLALALWLCGQSGNIMLGILLIIFYRLSLWLAPLAITVIYWLPLGPRVSVRKKLRYYLVHVLFCGALFLLCNLLFGNWY